MKVIRAAICFLVVTGWSATLCGPSAVGAPLSAGQSGAVAQGEAEPSLSPTQASELQAVLQQVFLDTARAGDLLGVLHQRSLRMTTEQQTELQEKAAPLRSQLKELEKCRYAWFYHLGNEKDAEKTLDALDAAVQGMKQVQRIVAQYEVSSPTDSLAQPEKHLESLRAKLETELAVIFPKQFGKPAAPPAERPATSAATLAPVPAPNLKPLPTPALAQRAPTPSPAVALAKATTAPKPATQASPSPVAQQASTAPAAPSLQQLRDVLSKVYLAEARLNDLLGLMQPAQWKMSDADRGLLQEKLASVSAQMKTLEASRYQLYYHPQSQSAAQQTAEALAAVVPAIHAVSSVAGQYEGTAQAAALNRPAAEFESAEATLGSYASNLQQKAQRELAAQPTGLPGHVTLETERITAPAAPPPPLNSVAIFTPPLTAAQVKAILMKMYLSDYRIRDLLSQEHPEQWKTPKAERPLVLQAKQTLVTRLDTLEKWRARFSRDPRNMYYAFETYYATSQALNPLGFFRREVSRYEGASAAQPYGPPAHDLEARLNDLLPYVSAILRHASEDADMIQGNLVACQNQLTYAMHELVHAPTPMKNVVPDFMGRRVRKHYNDKKR